MRSPPRPASPRTSWGAPDLQGIWHEDLETPLQRDPYDYLIVPNFIDPGAFRAVSDDFPDVPGPGSHPPAELTIKGRFADLMDELQGEAFRRAIERKFDLDLAGRRLQLRAHASLLGMLQGSMKLDSICIAKRYIYQYKIQGY